MDAERNRRAAEAGLDPVAGKLAWIESCLDQLRTIAHPERLRTDVREQRFIARTLQIALQAAKDAATQIASVGGEDDHHSGVPVFRFLAKSGWIPERLLPGLQNLNRVRQALIHKTDISADLLEEALEQAPGVLLDFVRTVRDAIQPLADVSSLTAALGDLGFGHIDERSIVSTLLAIRGKDPEHELRQVASGDLEEALSQTRSALRKAIAFLRDTAEIPHVELFPSREMLPVLGAFFHEHPAPSPRTRQLLVRWTWRRAVHSASTGDETPLRKTVQALHPRREDESVRNLLAGVPGTRAARSGRLLFDAHSAQTRLHLAVLMALHPRHLVTGEELAVAALCEQPGGPASPLFLAEPRLASRILHPWMKEAELRRALAEHDDGEILRSHLVSTKSRTALRRDDASGFLDSRDEDLRKHIETFLQSKAEWEASDRDRPSLASLIVADE